MNSERSGPRARGTRVRTSGLVRCGDRVIVGGREYEVLKPFYVMRDEPLYPSTSAQSDYTVVIAIGWGGTHYEPDSKIRLSATQAAPLLKDGVVRLGCSPRRRHRD